MRLKKRFIALFLAVLMLVSLCGCDPMSLLPSDYDTSKLERAFSGVDISRDENITFDQIEYSRPDIDAMKKLGADIEELLDEHAPRKDVVARLMILWICTHISAQWRRSQEYTTTLTSMTSTMPRSTNIATVCGARYGAFWTM